MSRMLDIYDISKMGYRELAEAGKLLEAYAEERPASWCDEGVRLACNSDSGCVFLTNEDGQVLMLYGDKVALSYSLTYGDNEGFIDELYEEFKNGDIDKQDYEELACYLEAEQMTDEAEQVHKALRKIAEGEQDEE